MKCYHFTQKGYSEEEIKDLMLLNMGPSHPASHGTIRNFVALEGETITACVTEIDIYTEVLKNLVKIIHILKLFLIQID